MKFQARKENIVETATDETMIYDMAVDKAYMLNETSTFIWQMCDGKHDLAEISRALAAKTKQPVNEDIVKLAIDQLRAINLLSEPENIKQFFTKTSRRQAIRQIGLATMIALPMIFSLTAPTAAHAASGQGNVAACQPCTQNSQCASGVCKPAIPGPGQICSNGSDTSDPNTARPRYNFRADAADCPYYAPFCCAGNGVTFSGTNTCRCNP